MMLPSERKRETLVNSEDKTDDKYGRKPQDRPIEEYIRKGAIDLDKPAGPTSHEVTSWVKKILNLKKAGHSGTLDPNVTSPGTAAPAPRCPRRSFPSRRG